MMNAEPLEFNLPIQNNFENKISHTVANLKPSGIREFFDVVASRDDIISLGVGEPDFVSPAPVLNASIEAIRSGYTHYTGNQGMPSLRKAISKYLESEYDIDFDPDSEILITVGVSQAIDLALRAIINSGDGIIYASPSYVSYEPMIALAGGTPLVASTNVKDKFKLNYNVLKNAWRPKTKALLLNYPCNPTGASLSHEDLLEIARFAKEKDLLVISDEIYGELTYESSHIPLATIEDMKKRTMLLGGFSKAFAMTGWRIAYACGPAPWIDAMLKIHQYSMLCAPTISQVAAEAALKECDVARMKMKASYKSRRDFIVNEFNSIGLTCHNPEGAFYVFPSIKKSGLSSIDFAKGLLEKTNVAVVPGTAFGEKEGEGFIRCSYATNLKNIEIAVKKIEIFLNTNYE